MKISTHCKISAYDEPLLENYFPLNTVSVKMILCHLYCLYSNINYMMLLAFQKDGMESTSEIASSSPTGDNNETYTIKEIHFRKIIWERRKNKVQYWYDFRYRVEWEGIESRENITSDQFEPLEEYIKVNHPRWYKPKVLK